MTYATCIFSQNDTHTIPPEFITLKGMSTPDRSWRSNRYYDELGFRNNVETEGGPIKFTHQGVWHRVNGTAYKQPPISKTMENIHVCMCIGVNSVSSYLIIKKIQ